MTADPFALLGLPVRFAVDRGVLDRRYRELARLAHPDRAEASSVAATADREARTAVLNAAYATLRDPLRRAEAILRSLGQAPGEAVPDAEFLMQVMEQREQLEGARRQPDALQALQAREEQLRASLERSLGDALDSQPPNLQLAREQWIRLRYALRFLEELDDAIDRAQSLGKSVASQ